jgi:type I restriction enzyme S subunit
MSKWDMVRLGDVCDVRDGTHDSPKYVNNGYPLITSKNLTKGFLDFSNVNLISLEDYNEVNKRSKVDVGDIVMPMIGTIGQPVVIKSVERPFAIKNVALIKFRGNNVHNEFIKNVLESTLFMDYIDKLSRGGTQKFIALKDIRAFLFPLPTIQTQLKIADILDRAAALIEIRKAQIAKLDMLVKSQFVEMFGDPVMNPMGWEIKLLSDICENLDSRRIPITYGDRKKGSYPYYGASGIVDYVEDYIFNENLLLVSEDGANLLARVTPIAFSVSGQIWVNNHAHVLRFAEMATQIYVEHRINRIDISTYITGTAQPKLNQAQLNAFQIPLPPLDHQNRFADFVRAADKSKFEMKQGLKKLELLFKSLMQKCFNKEVFI